MENPNNFLANSDYPFDMIIYYKYYEASVSDGSGLVTIPHGLGFAPLLFGVWSESKDFAQSFALVTESYNGTTGAFVQSDENNIYITKPRNKAIYMKIYGFAPTTWTGDCKPTAQSNTSLIMNTDLIYSPLLAAGAIQPRRMDGAPSGSSEQTGIAEDIGKGEYIELEGRASDVSLYYYEPISPVIMMWKTTASTGMTTLRSVSVWTEMGFPNATYPSATYNKNTGVNGRWALAIFAGVTRAGQANHDDITHFRVYG